MATAREAREAALSKLEELVAEHEAIAGLDRLLEAFAGEVRALTGAGAEDIESGEVVDEDNVDDEELDETDADINVAIMALCDNVRDRVAEVLSHVKDDFRAWVSTEDTREIVLVGRGGN